MIFCDHLIKCTTFVTSNHPVVWEVTHPLLQFILFGGKVATTPCTSVYHLNWTYSLSTAPARLLVSLCDASYKSSELAKTLPTENIWFSRLADCLKPRWNIPTSCISWYLVSHLVQTLVAAPVGHLYTPRPSPLRSYGSPSRQTVSCPIGTSLLVR